MKSLGIILVLTLAFPLWAAEDDALKISERIERLHIPYGTVVDVQFQSLLSDTITGYADTGDSSLFTGLWLAAESFRYAVTKSPEALRLVNKALDGVEALSKISGTDRLARMLYPTDSPFVDMIREREERLGIYQTKFQGRDYFWISSMTRDQYTGVFFGCGVAFDLVDDPNVKARAKDIVTRLLKRLLDDSWNLIKPDGQINETFVHRQDFQLAILQIGRKVNPAEFGAEYEELRAKEYDSIESIIFIESLNNHKSYFKFNLDYLNFYSLFRYEEPGSLYRYDYHRGLNILRDTTQSHINAHFNIIETSIRGPNAIRDQISRQALADLLKLPLRNIEIDLSQTVPVCQGDRSCDVIPVIMRPPDSFLWQRSPFRLAGGDSREQGPRLDYILPYWMGRHFGAIQE
ncbi:MAG: hypothetical protein IT289_03865 [Oligoflexia bacterium]|nr:hypothetical protein [Oligoflexia bacterium]